MVPREFPLAAFPMGGDGCTYGSCPQHQMPPSSVQRAIFAFVPILVAPVLLPVVAFASPFDPSWIASIYDDANGEDFVSLVCETAVADVALVVHTSLLPSLLEIPLEGLLLAHAKSVLVTTETRIRLRKLESSLGWRVLLPAR